VFVAIVFPFVMLTTIALPLIMQRVIDQGIVARDIDLIALLLGGYLALLLSRNVVAALRDLALLHIGTRISIALVHGFMSHLLRLKMSFFERRSLGDLIQRQQDHRRIEQFLTTQSLPLLFSLITFAIFGVMLAGYNLMVLGVVVVSAGLTILWTAHFRKYRRQFDQQQFEIEGVVQAHTVEIMSAVSDLKAFGMTDQKASFYRSLLTRRYDTTLRALRLDEMQSIGAILLMDIGEIVALYLAGRMVIAGTGSLGDFVAVMYILGQLRGPLTRLVPFFQSAQDAWLSLGRLQSLGEEPNEPKAGPADAQLAAMPASDITLNDVCFRYNRLHDSNVLDALNLAIPAGKVTAIVGESGSGKSTLIKLLARFHEPVSGQIMYSDLELSDTSADAWRQRVGLVLQDGVIFNATLSYNVTLSHGEADPVRLQRALDVANVSAFLEMLPLGVRTSIGRAGWQLSAGQQQRVLIARALYRDPEILIFDEATSALDSNNEADITSGLATVFEGRTSVVISHRLSTIRNADQIIVLKAGRVTEIGNHDALVAKRGAYFEIFNRQLNLKEKNP
jgi:ATP-binding cassette subfamily B protein